MITHHTQLLNAIIEKYGYKSYLEIGVQNPANNFDKINLPVHAKVGVDPCLPRIKDNLLPITSDLFFKSQTDVFDICFIDGLHHADQVKRDFENSLRCLSPNGRIVIHDILPTDESTTHVPRDNKIWHGDVYKWAMNVVDYRLEFRTYNIDNGCMVVQNKPIGWNGDEFVHLPTPLEPTWNNFQLHKKRRLRITDEVNEATI